MMTPGGGVLRHLSFEWDGETCLERRRITGTITMPRRRPYSGPVAEAWLCLGTPDKPEAGQRSLAGDVRASNGRVKVAATTVKT